MRVILIALIHVVAYGASQTAGPIVTTLYSFPGTPQGVSPDPGNVIVGPGRILYGTTLSGGTGLACGSGCGSVYSLTPPAEPGRSWTKTEIYDFNGSPDGAFPIALVVDKRGVLYGLTKLGGNYTFGTAFSLTPPTKPGGSWTETVLHSFGGPGDEIQPGALC